MTSVATSPPHAPVPLRTLKIHFCESVHPFALPPPRRKHTAFPGFPAPKQESFGIAALWRARLTRVSCCALLADVGKMEKDISLEIVREVPP